MALTGGMKNWLKNDDLFFRELEKGEYFQYQLALKFLKEGFTVQVPKYSYERKTQKDSKKYSSTVDLIVEGYSIEVKSRNFSFTCVDDISDRFLPLYISTLSSWKKQENKPFATAFISQHTLAVVMVPTSTFDKWTLEHTTDNVRGVS